MCLKSFDTLFSIAIIIKEAISHSVWKDILGQALWEQEILTQARFLGEQFVDRVREQSWGKSVRAGGKQNWGGEIVRERCGFRRSLALVLSCRELWNMTCPSACSA